MDGPLKNAGPSRPQLRDDPCDRRLSHPAKIPVSDVDRIVEDGGTGSDPLTLAQ